MTLVLIKLNFIFKINIIIIKVATCKLPFSKIPIKAYRILCMQFLMSCTKAKIIFVNWKILKILSQKMMTVGF